MGNFLQSATTEHVLAAYVAFQLYSAVVSSLPTPDEIKGVWYKALYNFLTILAADFKSLATKLPVSSFVAASTSETSGGNTVTTREAAVYNANPNNITNVPRIGVGTNNSAL